MVKKTLEVFECDKCGNEGQRYSINYPEGTLVMDRCETHARKIEALRDEVGEWVHGGAGRNNFRKSSLVELREAVEAARKRPTPVKSDGPKGNVRNL